MPRGCNAWSFGERRFVKGRGVEGEATDNNNNNISLNNNNNVRKTPLCINLEVEEKEEVDEELIEGTFGGATGGLPPRFANCYDYIHGLLWFAMCLRGYPTELPE